MKTLPVRRMVLACLLAIMVLPAFAQTYPLKSPVTLSYWLAPHTTWVNRFKSLGETTFGQELAKRTGVTINWVHPPMSQVPQNFNLMIASGELTDLIEHNFLDVPGGPDKLIKDGYILRLNEAMDKWAPNLKAFLKAHPDVDKMVKSNEGNYYGFPFIRGDDYLLVYQGPIIRQDWLDELGLKVPETIDDWTKVLRAFKEKKGASAPFTIAGFVGLKNPAFAGAFGANRDWYVENGKVRFGPAETQYKEFLANYAAWFKEGLIDLNIAMTDNKTRDALIAGGKCGATVGNTGGGIGYFTTMMKDKDPKAKFVAAPYPVLKKGQKPKFGQRDLPFGKFAVAISAKTKNLEAAVRFLDYGYGEEGRLYFNFGTPGVSYNMVKGYPTYTELIMKNPKLSVGEAMGEYIQGNTDGAFIQDKRYTEQYLELQSQKDAVTIWGNTDMAKYQMPNLTPDDQDTTEMAKIMSEVNTYTNEAFIKFIIGAEPIANFDKYLATLKKMNVDRAVAIYQRAYEEYQKR